MVTDTELRIAMRLSSGCSKNHLCFHCGVYHWAPSRNARIEVLNIYKLYTAVHDYDDSFEFEVLSRLSDAVTEKSFKELTSKNYRKSLQKEVLASVRDIVTDKWGLKVHEITITDYTVCNAVRISHDGQPVNINHKNNFPQLTNMGGVF